MAAAYGTFKYMSWCSLCAHTTGEKYSGIQLHLYSLTIEHCDVVHVTGSYLSVERRLHFVVSYLLA